LLAGADTTSCFEDLVEVDFIQGVMPEEKRFVELNGECSAVTGKWRRVSPRPGTKAIGHINEANDLLHSQYPAVTINNCGKGLVCALHISPLERYVTMAKSRLRDFMAAVIDEIFPDKLVKIKGTHLVDVVVREKNNRLNIHLINMGGKHDTSMLVYDEIVPLRDIEVNVRLQNEPETVMLLPGETRTNWPGETRLNWPGETRLNWSYGGGEMRVIIPRLDIHSVISIARGSI